MARRISGLVMLTLAVAAAALLAGCGGVPTVGSGSPVSKQYDFKDFSRLEVGYAFDVQITRGDTYRVEVTVDDNLVDHLRVEQNGSTVRIALDNVLSLGGTTRRATIVMPQLAALDLSGASRGDVSGFTAQKAFAAKISGASTVTLSNVGASTTRLNLSGASKANGDLKADRLDAIASGASQATLSGLSASGTLDASGASRFNLPTFNFGTVTVRLSGASTAQLSASRSIAADLSGASNLEYSGDATIREIQTSGASTITKVQ